MTKLLVGTKELRGKLQNYAKLFDIVELRPVDTPLPKINKLRGWRKEVSPAFAFSVMLPAAVASLNDDAEAKRALKQTLEVARVLQAAALVLVTPASVRPTQQNRERLTALRKRLPENGHMVAWEARGLWEPEDAVRQAYSSGFTPILDGIQTALPPGPVVYTRVHAMGNAASIGATRMTRLAEQLRDRRSAFVVADGPVAKSLRVALTSALAAQQRPHSVPAVFKPGPVPLQVSDEEQ